jgi:predicted DNA-binding transcriptional regulator AlpA
MGVIMLTHPIDTPPTDPDALLRIQAVAHLLGGCSRSTIWRYIAAGKLPTPIHIGSAALWPRREIVAAIARLLAERDVCEPQDAA